MARRNPNVSLNIDLEADASSARKSVASDLDKMERDAESTVDGIKRAFDNLSPELDTTEIRKALELADQLDGMVASFTVDTDLSEIKEAEQIARSLRSFQGRVDLTVEGRAELADTLDLAGKLDQLRKVKVEVQGREDLEKAARIADDLERRRTVPIDAQASDLVRLEDQVEEALTRGGEAGSDGIAGALSGTDLADVGGSMAEQMSGALAAAGPWAAAAGTVGALFGESFLEGFNNALPDGRGDSIRALRNNLSESDMAEVGKAGGAAYSSGLSDGLTGAKDAAALIQGELGKIDDSLDLTEVTRQASALEQVFGVDMAESVAAVDKLVSQGLVKNSQEGFNLLFDLGQQTGTQFDEMLELTNEFSTALVALGIDGPHGLKLIGEMVETGIFPQVDQAGEVFEELNETIISGGAAEALQELTGDAEGFTAAIASGGPQAAAAVEDIATKLLAVDDNAKQAQLTTAIFGGNMGLLGDEAREAALELFATAGATEDVGTAASDAADQIEESASGLDRLKKVAVDLGNELGGTVADGLDTLNALAELDFATAASSAADFGQALGERVMGPLATLADKAGFDPFGPLKDGIAALRGETDSLDFGPAVAGADRLSTSAREGTPAVKDLAGASGQLADDLGDASAEADKLEAELRGMFNFSADQLFRDIAAGVDDLAASLKDGGTKALDMGGAIDIGTDAGRKLQEQLEGLNGTLIDAEVAYANQEISAQQLAAVHANLKVGFDEAARAAGLTSGQIQTLTDKYLSVPDSVTTELRAIDNATRVVQNLQSALSALPTSKTVTVTTRNVIIAATAATAGARAEGGPVEHGKIYKVGEEGEELFLPHEDGQIVNADDTRALLNGNRRAQAMAGGGAGGGSGAGGARGVLEIRSNGASDFDRFLIDQLRKAVRNRGGIDVVFA